MTSSTQKSIEATSAPPVFSYAQAAKGRTTSTAASAVQSSQTTSGVSTPMKDTASTIYTPSAGSEKGIESINGSYDVVSRSDTLGEGRTTGTATSVPVKPISSDVSPSFGTASTSTLPKEENDDEFTLVGGAISENPRDRHHASGSAMDKSADEREGRKGKKSKKQKNAEKEAEKEKEEVKPEVLVPAPIPTVNFWLQRKEDAARSRPASVTTQSPKVTPDSVPTETLKSAELRKRAKLPGIEESEKSNGTLQNGALRESTSSSRNPRKSSEGLSKPKDEQAIKRAGPRGSRVAEKEEKTLEKDATAQAPPPVEDAVSWPTPETALEEDKRKAQEKSEKEEKDDSSVNKQPRQKEKWVTVPYIPTVTFNTPMPPRGGRGRGGARGGRGEAGGRGGNTNNSGSLGDKNPGGSTATSPNEARASKDIAARATSVPPTPSRQPEQNGSRNQRKGAPTATDKSKNDALKNDSMNPTDIRNTLSAVVPTEPSRGNVDQLTRGDDFKSSKHDQSPPLYDGQSQPRNNRQIDATQRVSEPQFGKDNGQVTRERADSRADRGRGGYRGRGGHNPFPNGQHPQNTFTNGHASQQPNGYPIRQSSAPYSPPIQQQPFGNQFIGNSSRPGRGGSSRSQSIPNGGMYGNFRPNAAPSSHHMAPIQTSNPMYDYSTQSMSAGPFNPYIENMTILGMVTMQIEYYFSIDNLCKDVFLRKHMDGQGYVFLSFIAGFKRIQSLTQEFELLKFACQESEIIDLVRGGDGLDRLRRKEGWEKWVLAVEERDEAARHPGPEHVMRPYPPQRLQPMQHLLTQNHHVMSPPAFSPNGGDANFRSYSNGSYPTQSINGGGHALHPETPLSAAVPDFAPGMIPSNGEHDPLEGEVTFNDDEVTRLNVVFLPKTGEEMKPKAPFHNSSSRTFSNGSIDGKSIVEESLDDSRLGRPLTNGTRGAETSPEDPHRSRSPFSPFFQIKSPASNGPTVMWVKGQGQQAISEHNTQELYTDFRARALQKRDTSTAGVTHSDMNLLYEFWAHFLCRNFNLTMYNEFRRYALEDSEENASGGMKNLIAFYDETLNSKKKIIHESLARDYVEIVKNEAPGGPAFEKLLSAWRNGAVDMKSRKRIDNQIDNKLRGELDAGRR